MKKTLLIFAIIFLNYSCNVQTETFKDTNSSINNLLVRFPILPKSKIDNQKFYKSIRKITVENDGFEIDLRRSSTENNDYQDILVFKNKNNEYYAIPFFSNMYRDYWNFPNEFQIKEIPKTNSTFETQFSVMLDRLHFDKTEVVGNITEELMISVLHCQTRFENDSLRFHKYVGISARYENVKIENTDSCLIRTIKNYNIIKNEMKQSVKQFEYFYDQENYRIYKFSNMETEYKKKPKMKIDNLRQDCVFYYLTL